VRTGARRELTALRLDAQGLQVREWPTLRDLRPPTTLRLRPRRHEGWQPLQPLSHRHLHHARVLGARLSTFGFVAYLAASPFSAFSNSAPER
jgi:hypothetical protein